MVIFKKGFFKDDKFENGDVKYTLKTGKIYEGELVNGKYNGKGKFTFSDGDIFEGDFKDDIFHGEGKLTIKNIFILDGKWIDSKFNEGILVYFNLPLKIELKKFDENEEENTAIIYINNNKFIIKVNKKFKVQKIINYEKENKNLKENENLKENFEILLDNENNYDTIKFVNAMNFILRSYEESEISNIYKFLGLYFI